MKAPPDPRYRHRIPAEIITQANYWLRVSTRVGLTSKVQTLRGFGAAA